MGAIGSAFDGSWVQAFYLAQLSSTRGERQLVCRGDALEDEPRYQAETWQTFSRLQSQGSYPVTGPPEAPRVTWENRAPED